MARAKLLSVMSHMEEQGKALWSTYARLWDFIHTWCQHGSYNLL